MHHMNPEELYGNTTKQSQTKACVCFMACNIYEVDLIEDVIASCDSFTDEMIV